MWCKSSIKNGPANSKYIKLETCLDLSCSFVTLRKYFALPTHEKRSCRAEQEFINKNFRLIGGVQKLNCLIRSKYLLWIESMVNLKLVHNGLICTLYFYCWIFIFCFFFSCCCWNISIRKTSFSLCLFLFKLTHSLFSQSICLFFVCLLVCQSLSLPLLVVYFDQWLGDKHCIHWSKCYFFLFPLFSLVFPLFCKFLFHFNTE